MSKFTARSFISLFDYVLYELNSFLSFNLAVLLSLQSAALEVQILFTLQKQLHFQSLSQAQPVTGTRLTCTYEIDRFSCFLLDISATIWKVFISPSSGFFGAECKQSTQIVCKQHRFVLNGRRNTVQYK